MCFRYAANGRGINFPKKSKKGKIKQIVVGSSNPERRALKQQHKHSINQVGNVILCVVLLRFGWLLCMFTNNHQQFKMLEVNPSF